MNNSKKENLKELLAPFMDADSAGHAAADIERGDELLRNWPVPQPSETLLAEVKQKMTAAARRRRMVTFQHRILEMAAVAATILVLSAVAMKVFENQQPAQSPAKLAVAIPDSAWEGGDVSTNDADIAVLSAEIDTVANEISGVELKETNGSSNSTINDAENELIEIGSDFWKG